MTPKDWEKFFELVDKIVAIEAPYTLKKDLLKEHAEDNGSTGNWEELIAWFDE